MHLTPTQAFLEALNRAKAALKATCKSLLLPFAASQLGQQIFRCRSETFDFAQVWRRGRTSGKSSREELWRGPGSPEGS